MDGWMDGWANHSYMSKNESGHLWLTPTILTTWEVEIRRIRVQGPPRQKDHETSMSTVMVGSKNWRTVIQAGLGKKQDPILKITEQKGLEVWLKQ
jgi:hypothetical protein